MCRKRRDNTRQDPTTPRFTRNAGKSPAEVMPFVMFFAYCRVARRCAFFVYCRVARRCCVAGNRSEKTTWLHATSVTPPRRVPQTEPSQTRSYLERDILSRLFCSTVIYNLDTQAKRGGTCFMRKGMWSVLCTSWHKYHAHNKGDELCCSLAL